MIDDDTRYLKLKEERTLILDIETKPQESLVEMFLEDIKPRANLKDPDKIKKDIEKKKAEIRKKMSTDTDYADIVFLGVKPLNKEPIIFDNLKDFNNWLIKQNKAFHIITYNGKKFDIPLIIKQAIKQDIDLSFPYFQEMTNRHSVHHTDLMEVINNYGDYKSLDKLLQIYLGIKKKEIDFNTCSVEELEEHNIEDLINTEKLYKKFNKLI